MYAGAVNSFGNPHFQQPHHQASNAQRRCSRVSTQATRREIPPLPFPDLFVGVGLKLGNGVSLAGRMIRVVFGNNQPFHL